jgi:hypothetical protein
VLNHLQRDLTQLDGVQEATVNFEQNKMAMTTEKTIQSPEN